MNHYRLRRNNLISDIFNPYRNGGYDVWQSEVRRQPIGLLHNRFIRRSAPKRPVKTDPRGKIDSIFVPPLEAIHHQPQKSIFVRKILKAAAFIQLMLFTAKMHLAKALSPRRLKLAAPVIVAACLLWVILDWPFGHHPKISNIPVVAQEIPVIHLLSSSPSNGRNTSANTSVSAGIGSNLQLSGVSNFVATPTGLQAGNITPGRGGGPGASGSGSTAPSSNLLPQTVTVPGTSTSVDGKTILDTSSTTITVN